jgi:hypothetical protein
MYSPFAQAKRLLRLSLLMLLVLGLMIKPVLSGLSDTHALEHASVLEFHADHHDHGHSHDHDDVQIDMSGDDSDEDHALGMHALMHQASAQPGAEWAPRFDWPLMIYYAEELGDVPYRGITKSPPTTPFRPPIA